MTDVIASIPHDKLYCGSKTKTGFCHRPAGWGTDHVGQGKCKLHGGLTPIKHGRYSKITRPRIKELLASFDEDADPLNLLPEVKLLRALIVDFVERYDEQTEALIAWHDSFGPAYTEARSMYLSQCMRFNLDFEAWEKAWALYREEVENVQTFYRQGWPVPPDVESVPRLPKPPNPSDYSGKPRQVTDILDAAKFIGQIGALVERIEKQKQEGSITMATMNRAMEQIAVELVRAATETIPDEVQRQLLLETAEQRFNSIVIETGTRA